MKTANHQGTKGTKDGNGEGSWNGDGKDGEGDGILRVLLQDVSFLVCLVPWW